MRILKVAVGNAEEAYIEDRFKGGINIISSDDNNKGKTIVIQSMMYALGNEPAFPVSFEYQNYSYYVEFEVTEKVFHICRQGDSFVLKHDNTLMIFDNVSEMKRYWTKNITTLPVITKNQISRIVDPVLFVQLFFVGQDKKDTTNIANKGFYNKTDFYEMLYSYAGFSGSLLTPDETDKIKRKIEELKAEKRLLLKEHKILKSKKTTVAYLSTISDRVVFEEKLAAMEKSRAKIETYRKGRNAASTRKAKWETTLKELRSLNRSIDCGELRCMDCNSTNISFSINRGAQTAYAFDVSTAELRNEIIKSIQAKISAYAEEIERLSDLISKEQDILNDLMAEESVSLESLLYYKKDIVSASDAEKKIKLINSEIEHFQSQLDVSLQNETDTKVNRDVFYSKLLSKMNELCSWIDSSGNIEYTSLYTPRTEIYSGSEATLFHLIKMLAFQYVLQHEYPIVIDSFRAEDLSTQKEELIIELFRALDNQIILTTTLKEEEKGKYDDVKDINHIDYSTHESSKLLSPEQVERFGSILTVVSLN